MHCLTVNAVSLTVDIALILRFIDIETNNKISINIFFKTSRSSFLSSKCNAGNVRILVKRTHGLRFLSTHSPQAQGQGGSRSSVRGGATKHLNT